ncbi:TetR/AcrR family transcriptional regulator [Leisingera sp. F5]|uniref:TetR/AcrR family transcriptional regulator n=1 Tax=Leisingera sp. F5 TaxID=1813816 RepID=UPI000A9A53FD|nr:TetR/AcrR family transcriptional regulator [Leisingera sp. F5]
MTEPQSKKKFHHGDLKTALIDATIEMIRERRVEDVSVADAARAAQVSSGAPYRHFKDRDELLANVAAEGFRRLSKAKIAAFAKHPKHSVESLIAGGCAYAEFGADNPELFHLMWAAARSRDTTDVARVASSATYNTFIEELTGIMKAQGLGNLDPHDFGTPLWAMVHGFASLLIGKPANLDSSRQALRGRIADATWAYVRGYQTG